MADIGNSIYKGIMFVYDKRFWIPFLLIFVVSMAYSLIYTMIPSGTGLTNAAIIDITLSLLSAAALALVSAYLSCLVITIYASGKNVNLKKSVFAAAKKYVDFLVASVLFGLAVIAGLIALVVPGLYIWTKLLFTQQEVIVKGLKPVDALKRSWAITNGRFWETFGFLVVLFIVSILIYVVFFAVSFVAYIVPQAALAYAVSNVFTGLGSAFVSIFSLCALTQFFFELQKSK